MTPGHASSSFDFGLKNNIFSIVSLTFSRSVHSVSVRDITEMGFQSQAPQHGQALPPGGTANAGNSLLLAGEAPLGRQGSSVFSLTLDEFQNVLGEPGKIFGSMNMDELLKNIWTAEESQAMAAAMGSLETSGSGLASQLSLQKQGSLALPRTLSKKTVEEVWKTIQQDDTDGTGAGGSGTAQQRQITFGEMTLEDFLLKAGVVREVVPANQAFISFGGNPGFVGEGNNGGERAENRRRGVGVPAGDRSMGTHSAVGPQLTLSPGTMVGGPSPMDGLQFDALQNVTSPMQQGDWMSNPYRNVMTQQQHHGQQLFQQNTAVDVASAFSNAAKATCNGPLAAAPLASSPARMPPAVGGGFGAALGNGGLAVDLGGGAAFNGLSYGVASPLSPASNGAGPCYGNLPLSPATQYGLNGQLQGRKRCAEAPVEKVIERRQRRMIKNRESAARSRARKQAYTVELEAEVTQLKEENLKLLRKQEEEIEQRKKQIISVMPPSAQKLGADGWALRRTRTGP